MTIWIGAKPARHAEACPARIGAREKLPKGNCRRNVPAGLDAPARSFLITVKILTEDGKSLMDSRSARPKGAGRERRS